MTEVKPWTKRLYELSKLEAGWQDPNWRGRVTTKAIAPGAIEYAEILLNELSERGITDVRIYPEEGGRLKLEFEGAEVAVEVLVREFEKVGVFFSLGLEPDPTIRHSDRPWSRVRVRNADTIPVFHKVIDLNMR